MATEQRTVWVNPTFSVGFVVAALVLVITLMLAFMHSIDVSTALIICGVAAIRL